ncbi:hypothetical protein AVO31_16015, partial [Yersinia pestis]
FFATRKREIENYLCPDLIRDETGVQVFFTDTCDAKNHRRATSTKPNDVLDRFWPLMTAEKIIKCSTYRDDNNDKIELIDILEGIVSLVD